jgi:hypothetical protein
MMNLPLSNIVLSSDARPVETIMCECFISIIYRAEISSLLFSLHVLTAYYTRIPARELFG